MDALGLPTGFGKRVKKQDASAQIAQTKRKASVDPLLNGASKTQSQPESNPDSDPTTTQQNTIVPEHEASAAEGEDSVDDARGPGPELPISHEVILRDHTKSISALSLDPSGARIISGSYDYECKLWDFGGMNSEFKPFRSWEAREGHQVHDVVWSATGDSFLCITGSNQAQLYDRDGIQIAEFAKGDMYIRDMRNCVGHIAELTSAVWHPKDSTLFATGSADSTIRIWETSNKRTSKQVIVVKSKERGTRTKVTACAFSPDGKTITAACFDGNIHFWLMSSNFARPNATIQKAHTPHTHTSGLCWSPDGKLLVSRGGDDTVKLWNSKLPKKPVAVAEELPSLNSETNVVYSPDGRFILTGTAGNKVEGTHGKIVFLHSRDLAVYQTLSISPANVIRALWHPKINQILTGSSDGSIHVLYSPELSTRGATLSLTRGPRQRAPDDLLELDRPIITPHALPMFKDDMTEGTAAAGRGGKRKREKERQDPKLTQKPMPPLSGPGKGGRVGASATAHVVQNIIKDSIRHEDPREALLRFASDHAGDVPQFTGAWSETAPNAVFDETLLDLEEEQAKERERKEEERKRQRRERIK